MDRERQQRARALAVGVAMAVAGTLASAEVRADPAKSGGRLTFVYAHSSRTPNQVHGFRWETDGTLTPLAGSPFATGLASNGCSGNCETLAYSRKRSSLFASGGNGSVSVLRVGTDGALTRGPNSPFPLPGATDFVIGTGAVDRGRRTFLYANAFANDRVHGLELSADGSLAPLPGSPWTTGDAPDGMAATNRHVFSVNDNEKTVSAFALGADGTLTEAAGSPFATGTGFSFNLATDLRGKLLYVGDVNDGDVAVHAIDRRSGALSQLASSPTRFATSNAGSGVEFLTKKLAVIFGTTADLGAQAASVARQGALTPLGGAQSLGAGALAAHGRSPDGKFVVIGQGALLRTLSVDGATGTLAALDQETLSGSIQGLRVVVR